MVLTRLTLSPGPSKVGRVFGNFSQQAEVRQLLKERRGTFPPSSNVAGVGACREKKSVFALKGSHLLLFPSVVDELLVVLLEHNNREVVFTVCGILMNMTADPAFRNVLTPDDGIDSLIEVR